MTGLITALLVLHGALHLLGVSHWWHLAPVAQMTGRTVLAVGPWGERWLGAAWLLAALLFFSTAAMRLTGRDSWWVAGVAGVLLSQGLVVFQWSDAWAGTLANVVLALVVAAGGAVARMHADGRALARTLLRSAQVDAPGVLTVDQLTPLPTPVRRWLERSGVLGRPLARTVRLRQRGGLRTAPGASYMPVLAEQYFTVTEPGFVWMVDVTMAKVLPVAGRDVYLGGHGRMLIRAGGLVTVADGTGPAFDQGTALRYLGEIIWFPSAAVAPYIHWTSGDDDHATATLTWGGQAVSATFGFDAEGRVASIEADRSYNGERLERWVIPITAWERIRGIEIPVRGGAVWKLKAGDFDYFQWVIEDVEANAPALWP